MKQLSGNDVTWYHPSTKEHAQEGKDSKEVSVLKGSTRDCVGVGGCNEDITCCPYNRHKQGNKEGLKNLILKLNKEKIAICTKLSSSVKEIMTTKMKGKIQDRATKPTMLLKKRSAFLLKEWIPTLSTFSFLIFDFAMVSSFLEERCILINTTSYNVREQDENQSDN